MMFCMRDTLKNWQTLSHWKLECNLKSDLFWTASTDHETDQEKVNIKNFTVLIGYSDWPPLERLRSLLTSAVTLYVVTEVRGPNGMRSL